MTKEIKFDWTRTLFVHVSKEARRELEIFLESYSLEENPPEDYPLEHESLEDYSIDWSGTKLRDGLLVWQLDERAGLLDELKERLEAEGFFVEEVSYDKIMEEEEITPEEWRTLLG